MYLQGSPEYEYHIKTFGHHKDFGYKDFIPMFTADKFDPEEWADIFEQAGAKYAVPVAEHHDGFQMYRSELSKFNTLIWVQTRCFRRIIPSFPQRGIKSVLLHIEQHIGSLWDTVKN